MFDNEFIDTTKNKISKTVKQAVNFTGSVVKYVQSGMVNVSDQVKKERLEICKGCEKYNDSNKDNPTCNECGCPLQVKTGWATESCPLKKWMPIATQSNGGCGGCGSK
jgi:tripartite-type tricarboxylate transporter receptor subunit TctC